VTKTYDRRQFLTHSAAAAGGVVAAGTVASELAFEGEAFAKPVLGGTLKMGVISEQNRPFNPDYANMDTSGFCYARAVYDPLMVVSADGRTVLPYLAAGLKPNATFTAWTLTVRPGIKFHNGKPCDGDAVFANMQANMASSLTGPAISQLISGFTHVPKSNTVVIHTKYKWVTFPYSLAEQQISFIAEPSTLGQTYNGLPIGTGPYIAQSWSTHVSFVATKNPSYWRAGLPYLNQVEFHPIPDGPTRMNALQSGTVDIIHEGEGDVLKTFPGLGSGYTWWLDYPARPVYSPSSNCMMMNTSKAPLNNRTLRTACAYAIDRSQFVKVVEAGWGKAIDGIYLPGSLYYKKPPYPVYNVAKAKALVAKVPKSQRSFTLTYVIGSSSVLNFAELLQSFLGKIGVTVTLFGISQGQLIAAAIFGTYQALTWAQFGGVSPDLNYPWFSTRPARGGIWLNFAKNSDPKIESLMLAGMAATSQTARVNAWASVNIRLAQDVPYLWTDRSVLGIAAKAYVKNWQTFQSPTGHAVLQPNQAVLFFTSTWR